MVFPGYIQTYFVPSRLRKLAQSGATVMANVWPEDCAKECVTRSGCRSFDYGRNNMECRLNTLDSSNGLVPADDLDPFDYYERGSRFVWGVCLFVGLLGCLFVVLVVVVVFVP